MSAVYRMSHMYGAVIRYRIPYCRAFGGLTTVYGTVEPLITHTSWWTAQAMGYWRLWGMEHVLKIDTKNVKNF